MWAMAAEIEVIPVGPRERAWLESLKHELFHGEVIVSRGVVHRPLELPGFVAYVDGEPVGAAIHDIRGPACELVSIDALRRWQGIGTALLAAVEETARAAGCTRLWLITTNDNTDALRFYQRRGFVLVAVHRNEIERSRMVKPAIPELGHHGIPLRDEIELEKPLGALD
jgi:GNAT superfamily N-acetyltransferase